jgi:signal transduction histidine kinase
MSSQVDAIEMSLERAELIARLRWFIGLRWVFGAGLIGIGTFLRYVPINEIRGPLIAIVGVAILAYNCVFQLVERWLIERYPKVHAERARLAATVQIVLDLMAITLVLHASGGVENPFFIFYIFHMIIATLLLPAIEAFILAIVAIVLFSGLAIGEMNGFWPHARLYSTGCHYDDPELVWSTLAGFSSTLVIAVYLGTSIAKQLRSREGEVLRLRSELADRAQLLEKTNEALRELDQTKTRHYRKISHELKSPLAAQKTLLSASLVELRNIATGEMLGRIQRAMARSDDLLALVNDLMLLSQTRDVTRRPTVECIKPKEHLGPLINDLALRAKEKGHKWRFEAEDALPEICLEPKALPMLAENLISNAIKYTPPGGSVTLALRCEAGHLVMQVRDTGIGISEVDLTRIGQEFFRTKQAKDSHEGGTGLGMTIVRSLVETAGGKIDIQSKLGEGTCVTVRLPIPRLEQSREK